MSMQSDNRLLARILETLAIWQQRERDLDAVAGLSEQERRDIGLSPATIDYEVGKPHWRA
jgi:uncharacterized protein YjiS (DUF1127 family)